MQKPLMVAALAAACFTQSPIFAQEVQDATIADPDAHSVVMENEHVRVISALAPAGYKSPTHSHPPLVLISLGTARVKFRMADGTEQTANFRPGTVQWYAGGVHSWELLAGEANVIAVEVKSAAEAAGQ